MQNTHSGEKEIPNADEFVAVAASFLLKGKAQQSQKRNLTLSCFNHELFLSIEQQTGTQAVKNLLRCHPPDG